MRNNLQKFRCVTKSNGTFILGPCDADVCLDVIKKEKLEEEGERKVEKKVIRDVIEDGI